MGSVVLAVGDPVFRAGLAMMIDADDDLTLVGEADTAGRLRRLVEERNPQVLMLDLHLPELDIAADVPALASRCRVQVLAKYSDDPHLDAALLAGATGYVVRSSSPEEILAALRR